MPELEPITRNEMFLNGDDLEPITREEMILAGADLEPITRHEWFLKKYRGGGGGGGYDLVNIPDLPADIASFDDGTDLPMASLKVAVTPYQDLSHGDPSPSNICPIIGWDEAVVTRCGKNLATRQSLTSSSNGGLDANERIGNAITGTQYTISVDSLETNIKPIRVYIGNTEITSVSAGTWTANNRNSVTFTANISGEISLGTNRETFSNSTKVLDNIQLEIGSTATTYEPYNGHTYTIDLDGTRYGGKVDLVSGEMVIDRAEIDLGSRTYNKAVDGYFYAYISDISIVNFNANEPTAKCEIYKLCTSDEWYGRTIDSGLFGVESSHVIYIADTRFSDGDSLKTALVGKKLVYTLATPFTVQLSPTPVKSLEGVNKIFANCGQITEGKYFKRA